MRRHAFRLPPHPASVSLARLHVRDHLAAWGHGKESRALHDVVLLVSELVTNAVCHGLALDREFEVAVTVLADGDCFIEVTDESPASPELREADPLEENGRGLWLLDALSEAWGVWQRGRQGKTVWALVRG